MNKTFEYFSKLNLIPRPSGSEEKVKDFLLQFAKEHNLESFSDKTNNVIIKKQSKSKTDKTLILQAHTDMVCEKTADTVIDFYKDKITTETNGDFISAKGTTLGADNGIGLSMILSVLDDDNLNIPNLECIFTAQEETTMQGAIDIDFGLLKGNHLLSIDGTVEGKIEASSAGMMVIKFEKDNFKTNNLPLNFYKVCLTGFRGGHSGCEIHTDRQNAIKVMFEYLKQLDNVCLCSITGGGKSNAIARECFVEIATNKNLEELQKIADNIKNKYKEIEKDISLTVESILKKENYICENDSKNIINFVNEQKNGVLEYSKTDATFPITSNNFANIKLDNGKLEIIISLRSSVKKSEQKYYTDLNNLAKKHNFSCDIISTAPYFEKIENSYLQNLCINSYEKLYHKKAVAEGVHAGLEGGVFAKKKKDLDICVIAPNIYDPHSPKEKVSISSIKRVYAWLEQIVENF